MGVQPNAKCSICGKDKFKDGKKLELNSCAYCDAKPFCYWCFETRHMCEAKKEAIGQSQKKDG